MAWMFLWTARYAYFGYIPRYLDDGNLEIVYLHYYVLTRRVQQYLWISFYYRNSWMLPHPATKDAIQAAANACFLSDHGIEHNFKAHSTLNCRSRLRKYILLGPVVLLRITSAY